MRNRPKFRSAGPEIIRFLGLSWLTLLLVALVPAAAQPSSQGLGPASAQTGPVITVHYIDVDQGAAALVELPAPCGAILIDAGGYGKAADDHLIAYLRGFFERRPDLQDRLAAVYITHSHLDHNTSLRRIVESFTVGRYIETGRANGQMTAWMNARLTRLPAIRHVVMTEAAVEAAGPRGISNARVDPLACAGVNPRIRILSGARVPVPGLPKSALETENNHSMTIRIDYGQSSFLWTGDMEKPALELLVARYKANGLLDTQVYQAGHHGAENGTIPPLVEAVTPDLAVISVGHRGDSGAKTAFGYGHPRIEALQLLEASVTATRPTVQVFMAMGQRQLRDYSESRAIYATGWDGDIVVTADAFGHLAVSTTP
jgi:beta-lactamase superfamily II metal-dependent hydrolase